MSECKDVFGANLRKCRQDMGLPQTEFAAYLNTNSESISFYELGKTHPQMGLFLHICYKLGKSPNEMLGWEEI